MDEPLHFDHYIRARLATLGVLRPSRTLERIGPVVNESGERLVIGTPPLTP